MKIVKLKTIIQTPILVQRESNPWCLQATWKVHSQEPFFDARLIVETSALFIAASFRIRHLDKRIQCMIEATDNLMRMQTNAFEIRFYGTRVRNTQGDILASMFGFNSVFLTP